MSLRSHSPTIFDQMFVVNSATAAAAPLKTHSSMWPASSPKDDDASYSYVRLKFSDFVDLQTRLVLLPRVEEEGRGAVVASFEEAEQANPAAPAAGDASKENSLSRPHQNTAEPSEEHRDEGEDERATSKKSLEGYSFVGLDSKQEDWSEKEFTDILALLREEPTPLTLVFAVSKTASTETSSEQPTSENEAPEESSSSPDGTAAALTPVSASAENSEQPVQQAAAKASSGFTSQESLQVGMSVLSSWGMRVRAQATEAASNISTVAKERAKNFQSPLTEGPAGHGKTSANNTKPCNIFIQTSVGAFVPVAVAQSKVTTSSLLLVRKSATEAAPTSGWSFQWYRSSFANETWVDETASLASGASRSTTSSSGTVQETSSPNTGEEIEWIPLEGATSAAFQPNATLIGRKLRCIVTIEPEDPASSDESEEDSDLASIEAAHEVCEINGVVSADGTLFNASRQALARGAKFGGLKGRGNAAGRQFRIEISIGMPCKKRSRLTTSSVLIYQMSGQDSVCLTENPILHATAHVPASTPKFMDLEIAVSPESVLSALCTEGLLQLETPNRLARESFLMALGVANYTGKPAALDAVTVLFKDEAPQKAQVLRSLVDEEVSVSSASCASSVRSQGSAYKSTRAQSPTSPLGPLISPIATINTPCSPTQSWALSPDRSLPETPESVAAATTSTMEEENRVVALERELDFMRSKLARKDKVVSELQRKIAQSDAAHEQTRQSLNCCQKDLTQSKAEQDRLSQSLQKAESYVKSFEAKTLRLEGDHAQKVSNLEGRIQSQSSKVADLEKANRSLQNEKAVLQAAVEARESKLTRMAELQSSFEELSAKVAQHDALRNELETSQKRYEEMQQDLRKVESVEQECRNELVSTKQSIEKLTAQVDEERKRVISCRAQLDPLQKKIQQLKGERNSYKQKNESLSKEVSRLCRNGRTVKEIEKIVADHQALLEEVETLRKQKKKALEDAHQYRMSYTQSKAAQELSGVETETRAALERNAELERLLAEMTEYVNAKEMQLDTMKQVNEQLQEELHSLARANLGKNEV